MHAVGCEEAGGGGAGQAGVEAAGGGVELGVAGVSAAENGKGEVGQGVAREIPPADRRPERTHAEGCLAVARRGRDAQQRPLFRELAQRVLVHGHAAGGEAAVICRVGDAVRDSLRGPCLAAEQHEQTRRSRSMRLGQGAGCEKQQAKHPAQRLRRSALPHQTGPVAKKLSVWPRSPADPHWLCPSTPSPAGSRQVLSFCDQI